MDYTSQNTRIILFSFLVVQVVLLNLVDVAIAGYESTAADSANPADIPTRVIAVKSEPQNVYSPDFPVCCKPVKYILKKTIGIKYIKLLFTDFDLPPLSKLLIYGVRRSLTGNQTVDSMYQTFGASQVS